ncbi:TolC family protein [Zhouia sp. PK063]|uniref:TolC family protein n=1 Tax=Zhouia sp. PK063 TaxID=3373602 RepID=UPI0037B4FA91
MRIKFLMLTALILLGFTAATAQEKKPLTLKEAVQLALTKSDEAKISLDKVNTAEGEVNVAKNNQYPNLSLNGQYQRLTTPNLSGPLFSSGSSDDNGDESSDSGSSTPDVNQVLFGQASASLPLFAGFKLHNLVKASENQFQAAKLTSLNDKEQIALQTIKDYVNLYKATKTVGLVKENLKSAQQRVKDFTAMEQNGLLARNDLLKAQLQESNTEVTLEEAKKNEAILSYKLATMLKLPEGTVIDATSTDFSVAPTLVKDTAVTRNDLEALNYQYKAAESNIKVAESKLYPSVSLLGGYVALDVKNALTVTNAMNFGVGVSYDLAGIFKSKSDVKVAKSKAQELQHTIDKVTDQIKVQIENANREYQLALKKFEVYTISQEQAVENYRIVKDKYDNGLVDTNDLLEADVQQLQAKINLAYAQADISEKYYELLTAKGTLTNTINK